MNILIAFGTTEGQTGKIAEFVAGSLHDKGHKAQSYDCAGRLSGIDVDNFDAVIVASSVHQRLHQRNIIAFVEAHRSLLDAKHSAFISVSLSSAFGDGRDDAQSYVDEFVNDTGWRPNQVHLAAGALRYKEYDFFKEQIIRHIVMADRKVQLRDHDCELTDWAALEEFTAQFVQQATVHS